MVPELAGVSKAAHVKDKLIEMTHLAETCTAVPWRLLWKEAVIGREDTLCTACWPMSASSTLPASRRRLRVSPGSGGGVVGTTPSEKDFELPDGIGDLLKKYLKGAAGTTWEERVRCLRLIENITMGTGAVAFFTESIHGAGSPQAQRIMIGRYAAWK